MIGRIKKQTGESLIEVVVATLIFAVGILGNIQLQHYSVKNNLSQLHFTQAVLAQNTMFNRLGNMSTAESYSTEDGIPNDENYMMFANNFINAYGDPKWKATVPSGTGTVTIGQGGTYAVTVEWLDSFKHTDKIMASQGVFSKAVRKNMNLDEDIDIDLIDLKVEIGTIQIK